MPDPTQLIQSVLDRVFHLLHQDAGKNSITHHLIESIAKPHFDIQQMTMLAIGAAWSEATFDQKSRLSAAFYRFLGKVYGDRVWRVHDSSFSLDHDPVLEDDGQRATVDSLVIYGDGQQHARLEFVLVKTGSTWKIIDVRVEGGSLVMVYRRYLNQKLSTCGMDGLIAHLEAQSEFKGIANDPQSRSLCPQ